MKKSNMISSKHMVNRSNSTEKNMRIMRLEDKFREAVLDLWDRFDKRNNTKTDFNYSLKITLKRKKRNA